MNNGRFWTIMDLGRFDLAARAGLMRVARRQGWFFCRSRGEHPLPAAPPPFGRFLLRTSLVGHDGRWFYFVQEFVRGGKVAAQAVVRAGLRTGKGWSLRRPFSAQPPGGLGAPSPGLGLRLDRGEEARPPI